MDTKAHWETVYKGKAPDAVSWYRPHLDRSLALIQRVAPGTDSAIIDVGGGESTLVDDLLRLGYSDVSVLDVSATAIAATKARLGGAADKVLWLTADITSVSLPEGRYDVWHDRAVFHFLTSAEQRSAYTRLVSQSVKPGGHVIVATFGPEGPTQCSGLDIVRYDADTLHDEFGSTYELVESSKELHETPFGTVQQFVYCYCVKLA